MDSYISKETKNNRIDVDCEQNNSCCNDLFKNDSAIILMINPETDEMVDANMPACSFYQYSH